MQRLLQAIVTSSSKIKNSSLDSIVESYLFKSKSFVTFSRNQNGPIFLKQTVKRFSTIPPREGKAKEVYEKAAQKISSFRINPFKSRSSKQTQIPTEQIKLEELKKLEELRKATDEDPTDKTKQLAYFRKLNELGMNDKVLERYASLKNETSTEIREEFLTAFLRKYSDVRPKYSPSGTKENPVMVKFAEPLSLGEPKLAWYTKLGRSLTTGFSVIASLAVIAFIAIQLWPNKNKQRQGGTGGIADLFNTTHHVAEKSNVTFNDVKGNEEAKEELSDIVYHLKDPLAFARLGAKPPKGVLLTGPPGCGKTMIAKALAGEAGVPFYFASGSEFEEMLVGVGARRMRSLFEEAKKNAPCIVFIDEIDAIGGKRDSIDNRGGKMTLNQLLVELDGFEPSSQVIVVAATNLPDVLDGALIRPGRFDRKVAILPPSFQARKDIFESTLNNKKGLDVDIDLLAKSSAGFTGADITNMVNIAAVQAIKQKAEKITMPFLMNAMDDVMMGPSRRSMNLSAETKKITAYHEGAHALVSIHKGLHQISKITVLPRGHALGYVSYFNKDEHLVSKETFMAELDTAMAGRVAEELIFGPNKVTGGAGSDFEGATKKAYHMVIRLGFSEKLGPLAVNNIEKLSPEMRAAVDKEVSDLLNKSYARTKQFIIEHKSELDLLANALLKHETLTEEEAKVVIAGKDLETFRTQRTKELQEKDKLKNKISVTDATVSPTNNPQPSPKVIG